jgi:ribosomal protein S18 acetylase RimI-like enzyme
VLFARLEGEIVGTTAVLKKDENTFEIAKMAVTEKAQGRQIGKKLTRQAIARAAGKGAKILILRTDNRLRAAINLYRSFGFRVTHSASTTGDRYEREKFGIQMKLDLVKEELQL